MVCSLDYLDLPCRYSRQDASRHDDERSDSGYGNLIKQNRKWIGIGQVCRQSGNGVLGCCYGV